MTRLGKNNYFRKKLDEEKGREQKKYMDLQKEHKELKKKHDKLSHAAKKVRPLRWIYTRYGVFSTYFIFLPFFLRIIPSSG